MRQAASGCVRDDSRWVTLDDFPRSLHAVPGADLLADRGGVVADRGITDGGRDRGRQTLRGEFFAGNRRRAGTHGSHTPPPKRLIAEERYTGGLSTTACSPR